MTILGLVSLPRFKAAVLGATGVVGQVFMALLQNHPFFKVKRITASPGKEGLEYRKALRAWIPPVELSPEYGRLTISSFEDVLEDDDIKIVFSAVPRQVAEDMEKKLAQRGKTVVSNAGALRMEADVPLINPEVNISHLGLLERQKRERGWSGAIVKNPNCTTAVFTLALKPIMDRYGVEQVNLVTLQSLTGAGLRGYYVLEAMNNVIPFIKNEEEKVQRESAKILGTLENGEVKPKSIDIWVTTTRVPVVVGHTEVAHIKLRDNPGSLNEVRRTLEEWRGETGDVDTPTLPRQPLLVYEDPFRPQPLLDSYIEKGMTVAVGRLDLLRERVLRMVIVGNNLVRGAAGAAVSIAEYMHEKGLI